MARLLRVFLDFHGVFHSCQVEFQKSQLFDCVFECHLYLIFNKVRSVASILVSLDFSMSFGTINHKTIVVNIDISYTPLRLLGSYLHDRYQCFTVNNSILQIWRARRGVPQGPLFYFLYTLLPSLPAFRLTSYKSMQMIHTCTTLSTRVTQM